MSPPACREARRHPRPVEQERHLPQDRTLVHALHRRHGLILARRPSRARRASNRRARHPPRAGRSRRPRGDPGRRLDDFEDSGSHRGGGRRGRPARPRKLRDEDALAHEGVLSWVDATPSGPPSRSSTSSICHIVRLVSRPCPTAPRPRSCSASTWRRRSRARGRGTGNRERERQIRRRFRPRSGPARSGGR